MKTSTKNAYIGAGATILAAIVGTISFSYGQDKHDSKVETTINQSGVINVAQDESSIETIERLLDEYVTLQTQFSDVKEKYVELEEKVNDLRKKNDELLKNISSENQESTQNQEISEEVVELTSLIDVGTYNGLQSLNLK